MDENALSLTLLFAGSFSAEFLRTSGRGPANDYVTVSLEVWHSVNGTARSSRLRPTSLFSTLPSTAQPPFTLSRNHHHSTAHRTTLILDLNDVEEWPVRGQAELLTLELVYSLSLSPSIVSNTLCGITTAAHCLWYWSSCMWTVVSSQLYVKTAQQ